MSLATCTHRPQHEREFSAVPWASVPFAFQGSWGWKRVRRAFKDYDVFEADGTSSIPLRGELGHSVYIDAGLSDGVQAAYADKSWEISYLMIRSSASV
jgi:hypothetical protein